MKIAIVITRGDQIGGAQIHVMDLACFFKSKGIEVTVYCGSSGGLTDLLEAKGVSYHVLENLTNEISPYKDIRGVAELRGLLKKFSPDIVSCHSSKAGAVSRLAAFNLDTKVIFTAHGWAFTEGVSKKKRIVYKYIEKALCTITDKVINVSNYDQSLALKYGIGNKSKHCVIHNGVKDTFCDNKSTSDLSSNAKSASIVITKVARFCNAKDHDTLLAALSQIDKEKWRLNLVGGGDSRNVKTKISELGLSDNVNIVGEVKNVSPFYAESDVVVLCSNWEGFPLTLLEAMSHAKPVIASDVGGVSEAVINNQNGFIVSRKNVDGWVASLAKLFSFEKRHEFGLAARKSYEENFSVDTMCNKYLVVFSEALQQN